MEILQRSNTRSSIKSENHNSQLFLSEIFSGNFIPTEKTIRTVRAVVVGLLTVFLLTLVPANAEYRHIADDSVNGTVMAAVSKSQGNAWDEVRLKLTSVDTDTLAVPAQLATEISNEDMEKGFFRTTDISKGNIPLNSYTFGGTVYNKIALLDIQDSILDKASDIPCTPVEIAYGVAGLHMPVAENPPLDSNIEVNNTNNEVSNNEISNNKVSNNEVSNTAVSVSVNSDKQPLDSTVSVGKYIWPADGNFTSGFGYRSANGVGSSNHKGIDICASTGDPIYAADGGEIIVSERSSSFGYYIELLHDNGHVTLYAHCSSLLVSVGERVAQGQRIALMGRTGRASAVHLHFELKINDENVNPVPYLA